MSDATAARMLALVERAVGANLALQFVAELGEITPLIADVAYANGYAPDPQISQDVFAAEQEKIMQEVWAGSGILAEFENDSRSAPKPRRRVQPLREAAKQVIAILYPNGVPTRAILPNKRLCAEVREYLLKLEQITIIHDDTILRGAGRK